MVLSAFEDIVHLLQERKFDIPQLLEALNNLDDPEVKSLFSKDFYESLDETHQSQQLPAFCRQWISLRDNRSLIWVLEAMDSYDKALSTFTSDAIQHTLDDDHIPETEKAEVRSLISDFRWRKVIDTTMSHRFDIDLMLGELQRMPNKEEVEKAGFDQLFITLVVDASYTRNEVEARKVFTSEWKKLKHNDYRTVRWVLMAASHFDVLCASYVFHKLDALSRDGVMSSLEKKEIDAILDEFKRDWDSSKEKIAYNIISVEKLPGHTPEKANLDARV